MSEKLYQFMNNLEELQESFLEDACLIVTDLEKITKYLPGQKIDLGLKKGLPISLFEGTASYKALIEKRKFREEVGPERFGIPYIVTALPLFEGGQMVGLYITIISNEKFDFLRKGSDELYTVIQHLSTTSEEMTKATEDNTNRIQELSEESELMRDNINSVQDILNFVKDLAARSRILGLNASIEAARAGESGRGFSVVADEIKKMGDNSAKSVQDIQTQLTVILQGMDRMNASIQEIAADTEEHSASVQEFNSALEQINQTASNLKKQAML